MYEFSLVKVNSELHLTCSLALHSEHVLVVLFVSLLLLPTTVIIVVAANNRLSVLLLAVVDDVAVADCRCRNSSCLTLLRLVL
jgi:hypothetical protein